MNPGNTILAARVMFAVAEGAAGEWRQRGAELWRPLKPVHDLGWNWVANEYRLAPTPKIVPWTLETVPKALNWLRYVGDYDGWCLAVGVGKAGITIPPNRTIDYPDLKTQMEWLRPDGTWAACGQEVVQ